MKKRKKGRTLSRTKDQRDALLRTMLVSLVEYQQIKTTLAKAKELRPFAERMLSHAKASLDPAKKIAKLRLLSSKLPAKSLGNLAKLAELMKERQGGYCRIVRLPDRKSDASSMALIEWTQKIEQKKDKKDAKKDKKDEKGKKETKEEKSDDK